MQFTIEVPDAIAQKLQTYLRAHPDITLYSLIRETLEIKLVPKNSAKLLALAGIVKDAP